MRRTAYLAGAGHGGAWQGPGSGDEGLGQAGGTGPLLQGTKHAGDGQHNKQKRNCEVHLFT